MIGTFNPFMVIAAATAVAAVPVNVAATTAAAQIQNCIELLL